MKRFTLSNGDKIIGTAITPIRPPSFTVKTHEGRNKEIMAEELVLIEDSKGLFTAELDLSLPGKWHEPLVLQLWLTATDMHDNLENVQRIIAQHIYDLFKKAMLS